MHAYKKACIAAAHSRTKGAKAIDFRVASSIARFPINAEYTHDRGYNTIFTLTK
jgi:hypothetical protein